MSIGDIVLAAGGTYASKPRPVLILQNDRHSTGDSTVVAPFTSQQSNAHYRVLVQPSSDNGLDRRCWVEVDKFGAIRNAWLGRQVGTLDDDTLRAVVSQVRQLTDPA